MMFDAGEFSSTTFSSECFSSSCSFSSSSNNNNNNNSNNRKKNKNPRRFRDDQIKSLESMFETETKLEPRKKVQVARELGLHPRQVAIWFQNKRARWKSKQLERDYSILQANYNDLASSYESLKKEKQSLVMQLQKLHDLIQKREGREIDEIGLDRVSDNRDIETNSKPNVSFGLSENGLSVISDDDSSIKADYFGIDDDPDLLKMVETTDTTSLTSPENWGGLDDDALLDQSNASNYQWWDFWS